LWRGRFSQTSSSSLSLKARDDDYPSFTKVWRRNPRKRERREEKDAPSSVFSRETEEEETEERGTSAKKVKRTGLKTQKEPQSEKFF